MEEELTGYYSQGKVIRLCSVLKNGGIAVLPTDTIYGLHCISSDIDAVERVSRIKGRGPASGFILIAADISMVDSLVSEWPPGVRDLLGGIWPASLTAILPASDRLPEMLRPGGRVAVRIPDTSLLREITGSIGKPLISTSVNRSGRPPMSSISEIRKGFPGLEAYISRRGRPASLPSTIVDFCGDTFTVVRRGAYDADGLPGEYKRTMSDPY